MDPVKQQLGLLGQNRALRATAIASALVESMGDDADTLMLEGLALLADRHARIPDAARTRLEQAMLVGWDRLSTPARSLARRQHQPILRRVLERAANDQHDTVRRKAVELARALATERDQTAWVVLRERLADESIGIVRTAAEAIAHAGQRLGIDFQQAEPAIIAALNAYDAHRSDKILLLVAEQADKAPSGVRTWLATDACAQSEPDTLGQDIAQHAMRAAAKRISTATIDRLVPVWIDYPCLAPVVVRRLQQATELSGSKAARAGKSARADAAMQAWANLLAAASAHPSPTCVESLRRLGHEPITDAIVDLASSPAAIRFALHACRSNAHREVALLRLLSAREASVRLVAVLELARLMPSADTDHALAGLAYDEEPAVAAAAVLALARLSSAKRHAVLDSALAPFAEHESPAVKHAAAIARRLTDPVADIVAIGQTTGSGALPLPWRAPIGIRAAIHRDAPAIARTLQRLATDTNRPAVIRRTARQLLNRALPMPPRTPTTPQRRGANTPPTGVTTGHA